MQYFKCILLSGSLLLFSGLSGIMRAAERPSVGRTGTVCNFVEALHVRDTLFADSIKKHSGDSLQKQQERAQRVAQRAILDTINGHYIPENLETAFEQLNRILEQDEIDKIKSYSRGSEVYDLNEGLGRWLRNNWVLYGGSRFQKYFNARGIHLPEEMTALVLGYYYNWLNEQHDEWKAFDGIKEKL